MTVPARGSNVAITATTAGAALILVGFAALWVLVPQLLVVHSALGIPLALACGDAGLAPLWIIVPQLLVVHCALGIPLALAWRRSRSLATPAFAHALIDGVRNALQAA